MIQRCRMTYKDGQFGVLRTVFQHTFAGVNSRLNISGVPKQSRIVFEQSRTPSADSVD